MPRARTTTQGRRLLAAVRRRVVAAVLAAVLAGLPAGLPAGLLVGRGVLAPDQAAAARSPARTAQEAPAAAMSPGGWREPTAAQHGSADATSPADREPGRLGGAATARRYGLPTVLAAVLVLGVASLQVRLLLAEPAARPGANPAARPGANPAARPGANPAEPSAAPGPGPDRRQGVGPPRW